MSDRLWLRVLFIAASMGLAGNHLEIITESPAGSAGLFWPATMLFSWGEVVSNDFTKIFNAGRTAYASRTPR